MCLLPASGYSAAEQNTAENKLAIRSETKIKNGNYISLVGYIIFEYERLDVECVALPDIADNNAGMQCCLSVGHSRPCLLTRNELIPDATTFSRQKIY